jgi:predicted amidohydrolase YtcJ
MSSRALRGICSFLFLLGACARRHEAHNPADFVMHHGVVYTVDSTRPRAEAVAIDSGRIVYVGTSDSALAFAGAGTVSMDLGGRMLLPGFHDTHVHPVTGGMELGECDLNPVTTLAELRGVVAGCARRDSTAAWVRGGGWGLPIFADANPSRQLLDSLVPGRPAYLTAADGHSAWANTRALALAGITTATRDPPNGRIERDASGNPSGTLREDAMGLVSSKLPPYTAADDSAGLDRGLAPGPTRSAH